MYNGYTIRIPERTAHARSHPQIWRQREELDDDEDDDDEDISSWVLVYEYEEDDLPDTFLGVPIDRQNRPVMPSCTDTISVPRAAAAINIDVNQATSPTTDEDEERPPTPWGNSTAKTRIIDCLKDKTSDIHLQIGEYTPDSFQNVNFKQIHKSYANKYKPSLFRENFKRLLRHLLKKTGPFEEKEDTVEPWATRKKRSAGWHLLYELRMVKETNDQLNSMTDEEIWESNKLFKQYPLEDFKKYNKDMATSTAIQRKRIEDEEKDFEQHCKNIPHNKVTDRGEPFWYIHPAKAFLIEEAYLFAMAISRPAIVFNSGPYPASVHDINIFRGGNADQDKKDWDQDSLYFRMNEWPGKKAVGDSGFAGEPDKVVTTKTHHSKGFKEFLARVKNRQESLHIRLQAFNILENRFRHGKSTEDKKELHGLCVSAIIVMVQYDFETTRPPFMVR